MTLTALVEDPARRTALRDAAAWKRRALQAEQTVCNLRADLGDLNRLLARLAAVLTQQSTTGQGMPDVLFALDTFTQPTSDPTDDHARRQARFAETGTRLAELIDELDGIE